MKKFSWKMLKESGIQFSYSNYHPDFEFYDKNNQSNGRFQWLYSFTRYISWGVSNRIQVLRSKNRHLNATYYIYDLLTSRKMQKVDLLFCWPQVSLKTIKSVKRRGGKVIIDYPIPHILTWQRILKEEQKSPWITESPQPVLYISDWENA